MTPLFDMAMDSKRAAKIRQGLSQYDFKYAIESSTPTTETFMDSRRYIDYFPYPAAVSVLNFFSLEALRVEI